MTRRARLSAVVLVGLVLAGTAPGALGQVLSPLPEASDLRKPTRVWSEMVTVRKEKVWLATLAVKAALFAPRGEDGLPKPNALVNGATFVLPWVPESATQESSVDSVAMRGWLGGWGAASGARRGDAVDVAARLQQPGPVGSPALPPGGGVRATIEVNGGAGDEPGHV